METVGQRIKRLREERGVSMSALAWRAGISLPRLSNYESGKREPNLQGLSAIADALEVSLDEFRVVPDYSKEPTMEEVKRTFRAEAWANMTDEERKAAVELTKKLRRSVKPGISKKKGDK